VPSLGENSDHFLVKPGVHHLSRWSTTSPAVRTVPAITVAGEAWAVNSPSNTLGLCSYHFLSPLQSSTLSGQVTGGVSHPTYIEVRDSPLDHGRVTIKTGRVGPLDLHPLPNPKWRLLFFFGGGASAVIYIFTRNRRFH